MLKKFRTNEKGFTLIELLIVVAIIGILAAIAIPQFANYRIKSFNSAALSDVRNLATAEAAFFADWQVFGFTAFPASVNVAAGGGGQAGAVVGVATALGVPVVTGDDSAGVARGLQIPVGNNVGVVASNPAGASNTFVGAAKHMQGDTYYAVDADTTSIFFSQVTASLGVALVAGNETPANGITANDDYTNTACAAGGNWQAK